MTAARKESLEIRKTVDVSVLTIGTTYHRRDAAGDSGLMSYGEETAMVTMASDELIELTVEVVAAYVARNPVPAAELPALLEAVYVGLVRLSPDRSAPERQVEALKPAVRIKKSVTDDYLICLEDGKRFKSLKRHLMSDYGLTPQLYRQKWGLPDDYPMVAPAYAKSRSALAKSMGFGRKGGHAAKARAGGDAKAA